MTTPLLIAPPMPPPLPFTRIVLAEITSPLLSSSGQPVGQPHTMPWQQSLRSDCFKERIIQNIIGRLNHYKSTEQSILTNAVMIISNTPSYSLPISFYYRTDSLVHDIVVVSGWEQSRVAWEGGHLGCCGEHRITQTAFWITDMCILNNLLMVGAYSDQCKGKGGWRGMVKLRGRESIKHN